jgi:hypothetical protein
MITLRVGGEVLVAEWLKALQNMLPHPMAAKISSDYCRRSEPNNGLKVLRTSILEACSAVQ